MYKYTLVEDVVVDVRIYPVNPIHNDYISLWSDGKLFIRKGYSWDGATGVPDLDCLMTSSLVHDALYQLMREGLLSKSMKERSDVVFREISIKNNCPVILAYSMFMMLIFIGHFALEPYIKTVR